MQIQFFKYQGSGNDFVMIDHREVQTNWSQEEVAAFCDRRFGIGADGLILLEDDADTDFRMVYYNSDGRESSMCGNGGRCIAAFARFLDIVRDKGTFTAIDGSHAFECVTDEYVRLAMNDVQDIEGLTDALVMDTGSPHYVKQCDDLLELDLVKQARAIRYNDRFQKEGINVNFVEVKGDVVAMRTYERGVEDETLSCGTGTVAVAVSVAEWKSMEQGPLLISTSGGQLTVHFSRTPQGFSDIWLEGPAKQVFSGTIEKD